ncbi:sugar transferase [Terribacillus saccharophilus]|uniref:sugar transferase n=1 Tax=Terribacillus saccharophilus TaxID=361277 RepID=UPI003819AE74
MAESKQEIMKDVSSNYENITTKQSKIFFFLKRIIDVFLSLIGLIFLIPVLLIIAVLIKIEDRNGPVIFKQVRIGKDGKTFEMYKFRSMVSNAEDLLEHLLDKNEASGPLFKMKEDPRVTKIGKFLRKTSTDELPQLFNVLRGEMSLVGPRPALPREVESYNSYAHQRLKVRPGLTCYWQVKGRSNLGFEQQVELDLEYIQTMSLITDLKLIFMTIGVLVGSKDAY